MMLGFILLSAVKRVPGYNSGWKSLYREPAMAESWQIPGIEACNGKKVWIVAGQEP